jgi:hypothetical protein
VTTGGANGRTNGGAAIATMGAAARVNATMETVSETFTTPLPATSFLDDEVKPFLIARKAVLGVA